MAATQNLDIQITAVYSAGNHTVGPYVQLVGRSNDAESVSVTVVGIAPYFWVKLSHGLLNNSGAPNKSIVTDLVYTLNGLLNRSVKAEFKYDTYFDKALQKHTLVELGSIEKKFDYYGYSVLPHYYAKLKFGSAKALTAARYALLEPLGSSTRRPAFGKPFLDRLFPNRTADISAYFRTKKMRGGLASFSFVLAEANITHDNQLLADLQVQPGGWVSLDPTFLRPVSIKKTTCCLEFVCSPFMGPAHNALRPLERDRCAPLRVVAWDLETWCTPLGNGAMRFFDGDSPDAKVLCASVVSFDYNVDNSLKSVVFALSDRDGEEDVIATDEVTPVTLRWFLSESALIVAFFDYIRCLDPDIITGYNTERFDWKFLIQRCTTLRLTHQFDKLCRWGTAAFHDTEPGAWNIIDLPGRVVHDMMLWAKRNRQYRDYALQTVCEANGLDGKDDVKYSDIQPLFQTHEGRIKLAIYCELDSRLVCQLVQTKALDPIGKTMALSAITGAPPNDLLFRGSMNTLRCCLLRFAHRDTFVLSCPTYSDKSQPIDDAYDDEATESRFQGGKVLAPITGFYNNPVVTLDFSSLYPSCMCELNICPSTSMTRERALEDGLLYTQPPAPSLDGIWCCNEVRVARCDEKTDSDIEFYMYQTKQTRRAKYTNELNESITFQDGSTAHLDDGGYKLDFGAGGSWTRRDADVLVFIDSSIVEGTIPKMERMLKLDRKKAKKQLAAAEARGDAAAAAYCDNLQNAIKTNMNALYGGLGSEKGGIFPNSSPLASAITARGRSLIVAVKKTVERVFWLTPDGDCGGFSGDPPSADATPPRPQGAAPLRVLYGDSVLGHTPVLVRLNGVISVKTIESLSDAWAEYENFKPTEIGLTNKQQSVLTGVESWTSNGWAPIKRVIRHHCKKRIYRVLTHTGLVDVTEDHSLLSTEGEILKPKDVAVGTSLMHFYPTTLLTEAAITKAFLEAADGCRPDAASMNCHRMDTKNQISAAWYFMLLRAMNFNVSINTRSDKPNIFRLTWSKNPSRKDTTAIKKLFVLHESYDDFVYDLETETGNFQAGVGQLIVKNTDSVMIDFPGCSLQQAAKYGALLSNWFGEHMLKAPHVLEFEKVLFPCSFYTKKIYAAMKYEGDYGEAAKGKIFARGLSAVRRDNALLIKNTVLAVMDKMFKDKASRESIIEFCGTQLALIHNSATRAHEDDRIAGQLPFAAFIQSAGISKELDEYDAPNAAVMVARQLLETNPGAGIGKGVRVTFVVVAAANNAKRCDQVLLPDLAMRDKVPLDAAFYVDGLLKKLGPLLSCFYAADERNGRRTRDVFGRVIDLPPPRVADQKKLLGQDTAERKLVAAFKSNRLVHAVHAGLFGDAAVVSSKRGAPPSVPETTLLGAKKAKHIESGQKSMNDFFGKRV
jgi:DNA polymerase elongation subunit (family B)